MSQKSVSHTQNENRTESTTMLGVILFVKIIGLIAIAAHLSGGGGLSPMLFLAVTSFTSATMMTGGVFVTVYLLGEY